ncbi:MAG: hypothetical protein C0424_03630 [Sphingobacteriaceae bacterium]|nr:hypothetical protein [Sphingobacteriaceae bacterium]
MVLLQPITPMKRLYLLRHAKAGFDLTGQSDAERVLTHSGKQDAVKLAYKIKGRNERIDLVCVSPAIRTRQTLDVLLEISGDCILSTEVVPALYQASENTALKVISDLGTPAKTVMLVGHNPSMTQLSNLLAADLRLDHLPTCGLVVIDFAVNHWHDITLGTGTVSWFDFPKNDYSIL